MPLFFNQATLDKLLNLSEQNWRQKQQQQQQQQQKPHKTMVKNACNMPCTSAWDMVCVEEIGLPSPAFLLAVCHMQNGSNVVGLYKAAVKLSEDN